MTVDGLRPPGSSGPAKPANVGGHRTRQGSASDRGCGPLLALMAGDRWLSPSTSAAWRRARTMQIAATRVLRNSQRAGRWARTWTRVKCRCGDGASGFPPLVGSDPTNGGQCPVRRRRFDGAAPDIRQDPAIEISGNDHSHPLTLDMQVTLVDLQRVDAG